MPWNTFIRSGQASSNGGRYLFPSLLPTMPMRSHEIEICLFLPPLSPHKKNSHYSVGKQTDYMYFHTVSDQE